MPEQNLPPIQNPLRLWYDEPVPDDKSGWENYSLPIGNGYMGLGIFGGIDEETLVLNEKTLWTGGPSAYRPDYIGGNRQKGTYLQLEDIRAALANREYDKAAALTGYFTGESGDGYGAYQLMGHLMLKFEGMDATQVSDYVRELNISESLASVRFELGGYTYTREYFANYPSNVIAVKLTTDNPDGMHFTVGMGQRQNGAAVTAQGDTLTYAGALEDNQLRYEAQVRAQTYSRTQGQEGWTDGSSTATYTQPQSVLNGSFLSCEGEALVIGGAQEVILYIAAATDYANDYPAYRSGVDPHDPVSGRIEAAVATGYENLKNEHRADYHALFDRVSLDLGAGTGSLPTDELVRGYQNRSLPDDDTKAMEALYFQYGRYLLISSSRAGSLPANLQGVWNNSNTPPWSGDYHINVNLQMNYWPAYVTNLAETTTPLIEYVNSLREPGRVTAAEYAGVVSDANHPENGWMAHTQSTPFGWTCPGWDFYWGWSAAASAWLDQNVWEYFEFTGDTDYLRATIYPILRESVLFYRQWLICDEASGRMVSSPTYSPEHGPVTAGNTYEQSLIEQLFSDFIAASAALNCDAELRTEIEALRARLDPYQIGGDGMINEWYDEDDPSFDGSAIEQGHRHLSQLLGLYPGKAINYDTPELLEAAIASLNDRGDEATGWAKAHKLCLWARTGDGERSYKLLQELLLGSTLPNLWDSHPPFQIDGNFGGTAGITEMLLQSHMGYIQPLPALPDAWGSGSVSGLVARGNFTVDMVWAGGELTGLTIKSAIGGACAVRYAGIAGARVKGGAASSVDGDLLTFDTEPGDVLTFTFGA